VADALSRCDTEEANNDAVLAVSAPRFDFITRLHDVQASDLALVTLREEFVAGSRSAPWALTDDFGDLRRPAVRATNIAAPAGVGGGST
jgi:hypothetical protein